MLAYCIRCKEKVELIEGKLDYYKNGTPVEKGKCVKCGCKLVRILTKEERLGLKDKQKQDLGIGGESATA